MARTKKPQPDPSPQPQPPAVNGPAGDVLTLAEAAAYLRLPEADVIGAVSTQGLPGRLIRHNWRFSREAIHHWLGVEQPLPEMRKAAMMRRVHFCLTQGNCFPPLGKHFSSPT